MKLKHQFLRLQSGNMCCKHCELIKQPPPDIMGYAQKWHYWYLADKGDGNKIDKTYCYKRNEKTNI